MAQLPPNKKRGANVLFVATTLAITAGAIAWLVFGSIGQNLVYYWTPSELHSAGTNAERALVRLGGRVVPGSLRRQKDSSEMHFHVSDGKRSIEVHTRAIPPQMFREGIGVVVEGKLGRNGIFESDRLLVKHSNEYRPPAAGKTPNIKRLTETLRDPTGSNTAIEATSDTTTVPSGTMK